MVTTVRTVCPHDCPDQCSIIATVEDGRLLRFEGDKEHPFTRGFLCGKVNRYPERVHSPERVLTPLRRVGPKGVGEFAPVSWDEALDQIAGRWQAIIAEHGSEALLGYAYSGHMGVVNRNIPRALFHALGASRMIAGTVCDSTCSAGWEYAAGQTPGTDPETVVDSDLIISWGANLVTTNVHLIPLIDDARDRGAKLVVIDPYRTRTAHRADWHIAPRVGTDTALALGMMHVLVRDGLCDMDFVAARTTGFERLRDEVLPHYTPEWVAEITGLSAADVERLGQMYGRARAPFLRLGMGMSRNMGGGMAVRTVACLPALMGAWGKPGGGALLDTALAWQLNYNAVRRPDLLPRPTREVNHSLLGRALLESADPPIMALFVAANNPAVTCPDQARVAAGLRRDDLFTVVHDPFLSDTARYADIVLPACTPIETEDVYRSYGTFYIQHGPRLIPPQGESRSILWLVQQLADRLGLDDPVFRREPREHINALLSGASGPSGDISPEGLIGAGPVKLPYPQDGPPITYLYSEAMAADGLPPLPGWSPDEAARGQHPTLPLRLLTLPGHFQHHTAFAGVASLRRRQGVPTCVLHPEDAGPRGIADGDPVLLFNELGEVGLYARVSDDTLAGVVTVEGSRTRAEFLYGGPLNVLVSDSLADLGAGATYQSTRLDVRPLPYPVNATRPSAGT
ncbi:MAG: molybdopterin-dependent oxidoreductase [Chloroflexi bacterium]|nr:molybdopterin-dependent oxidoreductase [Chloroflexota bacterium]